MVVKVKQVVKYDGHNIAANGSVNLNFKAAYSDCQFQCSLSDH